MQNQQNERFFIYDCNGTIVGNPKGYATIKGAIHQQNLIGSKAYIAIWRAVKLYKQENPYRHYYHVSSVKFQGENVKNQFNIS